MNEFLLFGTALGAAVGILHGLHVYRMQAARADGGPFRGAYYALWTFALWSLFGSYVLAFWLLGGLLRLATGSKAPPRTA